MRLGTKGEDADRQVLVHLCVLDSNRYKLILGMDILNALNFLYDGEQRRLHLHGKGGEFSLPLASREYASRSTSWKRYQEALSRVESRDRRHADV